MYDYVYAASTPLSISTLDDRAKFRYGAPEYSEAGLCAKG